MSNLDKWQQILNNSFDSKELENESAAALRFIADNEDRPPTDEIDFKKIYHFLADAMEGKPLPEDPVVAAVLKWILQNRPKDGIQINLKMFEDQSASGSHDEALPLPTDAPEMASFKNLISQKAFNPLNIPMKSLKLTPSAEDSDSYDVDESSSSTSTDSD